MAQDHVALELLLNKATSPALNDDDWDSIAKFCDQVNKELEGPQLAVRLLAHKIQSPTEREALSALSTIEACVKSCGRTFHKEIGKFRFLNEMIKLLSPKYLAGKTTDRVKKRSIELLYSWYKGLPHETKIGDAYKMLKEQKIIKEDPTYMDKTFDPFPAPKPCRADFEDEERAQELSRLLQSKNPEDLKAANKLIKEMVKEDAEKSERRWRRINELEGISTQVKLLTEMVKHYQSSSATVDIDMMKELYEDLEKQRPKLFRLAGETEEQETEAINEILKVNDTVTEAMSLYMKKVQRAGDSGMEVDGAARDSSLLDLGFNSPGQQAQLEFESASGASAILQSEFQNLGLVQASPAPSLYTNLSGLFVTQQQQQQQQGKITLAQAALGARGVGVLPATQTGWLVGGGTAFTALATSLPSQPPFHQQQIAPTHFGTSALPNSSVFLGTSSASSAAMTATSSSSSSSLSSTSPLAAAAAPSAMTDLDMLGQSLLDEKRTKTFVWPSPAPPPKLSMNQLAAAKTAATSQQQPSLPPPPQPSQSSVFDTILKPSPPSSTSVAPVMQNSVVHSVSNVTSDSAPLLNGSHSSQTSEHTDNGSPLFSPMTSAPLPTPDPSTQLLPLTDVFVPLESIKPAEDVSPLTVYDKHGLKSLLHFSTNRPRPDVLVMVLSTLSTNSKAVNNFVFQAAVPKVMKIKLQTPSAAALPAFNPILPPTAITQVLLMANPHKEKIRLKFKISYSLGEEPMTDVGDVQDFPVS